MPYIQAYDEIFDECFQIEITQEFAEKIKLQGGDVVEGIQIISETLWPNLPIKSRLRSERHPGWGSSL